MSEVTAVEEQPLTATSRRVAPRDELDVRCPFCDAAETGLVSLFGSQLLMSQHQCRVCRSYFEAVRSDIEDTGGRRGR